MDVMSIVKHKATYAVATIIISVYFGIGELGIIGVLACAIFMNLGKKEPGEDVSGYAVFNRNQQALPGSLSVEDFDQARRNQASGRYRSTADLAADVLENDQKPDLVLRASKFANKPCSCNSGLKYKKCCGKVLTKEDLEMKRHWENEWT